MKRILGDAQFRRRALFVLGNLVICVAIVGFVLLPVYTLFADRESRIEEQRKVLMRLAAVAEQAANVQSIASDTKAQMQGGEFLVGPNENVISADLQTKLKAVAEAGGAKLRAVQALPVKSVDQIRYSGSRIEIFGSLQSIVKAVHAIESLKPYLFITGAALKSPPPLRPGVSEEPVVQAQLDVFGAVQVGGQP
jgi:general secretion pathway protein M